ncbi:cobalt-precorrin 5A hydrolase [Roseburia sp. MSJ-14]|uniref:cobalt-precorrin 5A hydrolase n=1 Tax=Roseburia sp. MSJ-14 TaxID=2841514 RepID=UPI001C10613A|nr:cobalt-precorrin 5A hydrolase [Roseburia sp. MSJ-14]MBU5472183.1 cobalt-precorrin 5A hydrolase [Roseburia sp. MSJ-14]
MQIEIISFTGQGSSLAEKIKEIMKVYGNVQVTSGKEKNISLQTWTENAFSKAQVLIFVGAAGIAVRAIAPFVQDKFKDPAVLVVDEKGTYVIPVLSGHVGGANAYALQLAEKLQAQAVITTATDINQKFAVDVFAKKNQLFIKDRAWAKEISAAILGGEKIGFFCEGQVTGTIPEEVVAEQGKVTEKYRINVGIHNTCQLIPKAVTVGVGCRKGKSAEEIETFVLEQLEKQQIAMESISCVASVDKKKNEAGIFAFCEKYGLEFQTFSPEELERVPGEYTQSEFVEKTIGVGNVCERAAICAWKQNRAHILQPKTAQNGKTLAIAEKEWSVRFE